MLLWARQAVRSVMAKGPSRGAHAAYRALPPPPLPGRCAGATVVVEEFLTGEEASFFAFIDGESCVPLVGAQVRTACRWLVRGQVSSQGGGPLTLRAGTLGWAGLLEEAERTPGSTAVEHMAAAGRWAHTEPLACRPRPSTATSFVGNRACAFRWLRTPALPTALAGSQSGGRGGHWPQHRRHGQLLAGPGAHARD